MQKFSKILIANRGEIALRMMKTCKAMFIQTVAVYSNADKNAPHVKFADEAIYIGKSPATDSYLNQDKIIQAARLTAAEAIHPGYGFLSENGSFAQRCQEEALVFIGPSPAAIQAMGSKIEAKKLMLQKGIPVVPGYEGANQDIENLIVEAEKIGFPVLIKASAGGGGKGMRIVRKASELKNAIEGAKREALSSFGDDKILLEKYFDSVRHIEFQILGDNYGNLVHLFERECSIQRRHQKIIEEAPSPFLSNELREKMGETALKVAQTIGYNNAGTVEFIVDRSGNFYFLEVNTRLQVEHPVTECITGLDLVKLQIEIAQGKILPFQQKDIAISGHAIEYRLYAEDPQNHFLPASGNLALWKLPENIRVDAGVESGSQISTFYDPMLAKVIVKGENREDSLRKSTLAIKELLCLGISNNQDFLLKIIQDEDFRKGNFDTHYLENHPYLSEIQVPDKQIVKESLIAAMLYNYTQRQQNRRILPQIQAGWRNNFYQPQFEKYQLNTGEKIQINYRYLNQQKFETQLVQTEESAIEAENELVELIAFENQQIVYVLNQKQYKIYLIRQGDNFYIKHPNQNILLKQLVKLPEPIKEVPKGAYTAPMPGEVVKILVETGQKIKSGDALLLINSMKMENTVYAHADGVVEEIFVKEKTLIEANAPLLKVAE